MDGGGGGDFYSVQCYVPTSASLAGSSDTVSSLERKLLMALNV